MGRFDLVTSRPFFMLSSQDGDIEKTGGVILDTDILITEHTVQGFNTTVEHKSFVTTDGSI